MGVKKCPNCAEEIQLEAKYCIHCERNIETGFFVNFDKKIKITGAIIVFLLLLWIAIDYESFIKVVFPL